MRLISKQAFRDYVDHRGPSNEELAEQVTRILKKDKDAKVRRLKCSTATIAFLRSDGKASRTTCGPHIANAIEKALNAPPGSLFAARLVAASTSNNRRTA